MEQVETSQHRKGYYDWHKQTGRQEGVQLPLKDVFYNVKDHHHQPKVDLQRQSARRDSEERPPRTSGGVPTRQLPIDPNVGLQFKFQRSSTALDFGHALPRDHQSPFRRTNTSVGAEPLPPSAFGVSPRAHSPDFSKFVPRVQQMPVREVVYHPSLAAIEKHVPAARIVSRRTSIAEAHRGVSLAPSGSLPALDATHHRTARRIDLGRIASRDQVARTGHFTSQKPTEAQQKYYDLPREAVAANVSMPSQLDRDKRAKVMYPPSPSLDRLYDVPTDRGPPLHKGFVEITKMLDRGKSPSRFM
jgi:hypothetical protein